MANIERKRRHQSQQLLIEMKELSVLFFRKPIKNINIRIDRQGVVKVSAPIKCPLVSVQHFLEEKYDWITTHQKRLLNCSVPVIPQLHSGEQYWFLGQSYSLVIYENTKQQRIVLEGNHIYCYTNTIVTCDIKQTLLQNWQKQQMKSLLPTLIQKWEAIIGVQVNQWGIKAMKTRWGSCNTIKKRIWLNLHLIQKPLICLEYVLVHELVHLLEASHNKQFYALMSQFMPEWKERKRILNLLDQ